MWQQNILTKGKTSQRKTHRETKRDWPEEEQWTNQELETEKQAEANDQKQGEHGADINRDHKAQVTDHRKQPNERIIKNK